MSAQSGEWRLTSLFSVAEADTSDQGWRDIAAAENVGDWVVLHVGATVWMQDLDEAKQLCHAMHVDVSLAREHVEARVTAALAAEGRIVDDSNAPAHWTLADRAGNRVCICAWPDGSAGSDP